MTYDLKNYFYNGFIIPMEIWRPITSEMVPNVKLVYWISNLGNVYNAETNSYFNQTIYPNRYVNITLYTQDNKKINALVHRLVCMAFHGMPTSDKCQVDHVNGDKSCNFEGNTEWVTPQENTIRAIGTGLKDVGEDVYRAVFTNDEVREICEMLCKEIAIDTIADIMQRKIYPRQYSDIKKIIYDIMHHNSWNEITKDYNIPIYSDSQALFTDNEVEVICKMLENEETPDNILKSIGRYYDKSNEELYSLRAVISAIKNGFRYTHISSKYNLKKGRNFILSENEIDFICESVAQGLKPKEILQTLGERGTIKSVQQSVYNISAGLIHKKKLAYYKSKLAEGSTTIS